MTTPDVGITRYESTSRYADPRTAAATRPVTPRRRARVRTAVAAPHDLYGSIAAVATIAITPPRKLVTDAADQLDPNADPDVPTRTIDGTLCTNRAGIAHLAGWPPGDSARNVYAGRDPDFPKPFRKVGREFWYAIEQVDDYLAILAERAAAKKPPAVKDGNPDDLLHGEAAADALHIEYATLRSYVRYSVPYWTGEKQGRPLLPRPDVEEEREYERFGGTYTHREWYRRTLAEHQQQRPGPGSPPVGRVDDHQDQPA